jgi:hypothetical protein
MQCAFAAHLICGIGHGVRIEALPARPAVKLPAFPEIHGGLVHHRFDPRHFGLRHPRGDQRSTPAHAPRLAEARATVNATRTAGADMFAGTVAPVIAEAQAAGAKSLRVCPRTSCGIA